MKKSMLMLASTALIFSSTAYSLSTSQTTVSATEAKIGYDCYVSIIDNAAAKLSQYPCYSTNKKGVAQGTQDVNSLTLGTQGQTFVIAPPAFTCTAKNSCSASVYVGLSATGAYPITMSKSAASKLELSIANSCPKNAQNALVTNGGVTGNDGMCLLLWTFAKASDLTKFEFTVKP